MGFRGNSFMGSCKQLLNFLMQLYNVLYNVINLLCFFKTADFYFFGNNLFLLLLSKPLYPVQLKDRRPLSPSARLGFSKSTIKFIFCLRGKTRRKARNCSPMCFHFCTPKHISYFSPFASVFRISK